MWAGVDILCSHPHLAYTFNPRACGAAPPKVTSQQLHGWREYLGSSPTGYGTHRVRIIITVTSCRDSGRLREPATQKSVSQCGSSSWLRRLRLIKRYLRQEAFVEAKPEIDTALDKAVRG